MKAVLPAAPERGHEPVLGEQPEPIAGAGEVLVEVRATALNRADLLQLRGLYPPPPGESSVPGLECSGVVVEAGADSGWRAGDRVMALLAGGGQARRVAVPDGQLMRIPENLDFEQAAALPEAGLTAWTNLVHEAALASGEWALVTGATGGVGSFAVQLAAELGARVIGAARDLERLHGAGVDRAVRDDETLPQAVRELTGGPGVDVMMDLTSGSLLETHLAALAPRGRLILVGLMAGGTARVDLSDLLRRRLSIRGSVLRPRGRAEKAALVAAFEEFAAPRLADGRLRAAIHRSYPFERIADAYQAMERGGVSGKIVVVL